MSIAGRTIGRNRSRWKMWTAALIVKPPAASTTPHSTSKPIQSPQGNASVRFVAAPRPWMKRMTVA